MQANIALIGKNSLMMQGLKSMLEKVMPIVNFAVFNTVAEMTESNDASKFFHYFITPSAYTEDPDYFIIRKKQTILLSDGEDETEVPDSLRRINMLLPQEDLLKQLLVFQQFAHQGYTKYPHAIAGQLKQQEQQEESLLSNREIDVLQLLARGLINKEIADQLNISVNTVITHRKNIMLKLQSESLSRLVIYAVQHGYIKAEDIK